VTIGVTSYNQSGFLRECLDSIMAQTRTCAEILVVDDCSTDDSVDVARSYGDRVHLIRHESNSGSAVLGQSEIIREATGDYLHLGDGDDYLDPDFVERLLAAAESEPDLDWIAPNIRLVDVNGRALEHWDHHEFPDTALTGLHRGWTTASVPVPMKGIWKTQFLRSNDLSWYTLPGVVANDDTFTCIRYLECDPKIRLVPDFLVNYRIHGGNVSRQAVERARMVVGLKEYYVRHFSEMVYLSHPAFLRLEHGSGEYLGLKYFLVAADLLFTKLNFRVPAVYGEPGSPELERAAALFDAPIRRYAELAATHCPEFRDRAAQLVAGEVPDGVRVVPA